MKRVPMALFAVLCVSLSLLAGEKVDVNKDLALDPAQAGPDYKIQGEYSGEITTADGKKKYGAQIMALGGGNFRAVYYMGGLPGDGWDGDTKLRVMTPKEWVADGKTDGDKTVFEKPYAATLSGDTLSGKTDKGEAFECKKVMRVSPTMGAKPPAGAIVLFDGTSLDKWTGGGQIDERKFISTAHGNSYTKQKFQNYTLHVEYMEPFKPYGREQDRGNSGVYQQNRYEVQVLDSFGRMGKNNEAGGIYTKAAPKLNMCYPPLSFQTYDIDFTAAKFDGDKKVKNAVVTIKHNGVLIHENQEITGSTGGGEKETPEGGSIQLQGHGNPVFFRNIWIVENK
ncbi:MAG TPA: DUF1080 domain-containing protein [Planctomycetota bacterium]|nr:DUF1080 domain-containing protein [Planctomycetota bacterium]